MQFNLSTLKGIAGLENFDLSDSALKSIKFINGILASAEFPVSITFDDAAAILSITTTSPVPIGVDFLLMENLLFRIKVKDVAGVFNFENVQTCTGSVSLSEKLLAGGLRFTITYSHPETLGNSFSLALAKSFAIPSTGLILKTGNFKSESPDAYSIEGTAEYDIASSVIGGLFGTGKAATSGELKINIVKNASEYNIAMFDFGFTLTDTNESILNNATAKFSYTRVIADWNVSVKATVTNDWNPVAKWLKDRNIITEVMESLPETTTIFEMTYKQTDAASSCTITFKPANGDWQGMPLSATDTVLTAKATIKNTGMENWSVNGVTRLTIKNPEAELFPLTNALFSIHVTNGKLTFQLDGGLPNLNIPNILSPGSTLVSFTFNTLALSISKQIVLSGSISYNATKLLANAAGLEFLKPFLEKIDALLAASVPAKGDITFQVIISSGTSFVEVTLNLHNAPEFELFELLAKGLHQDFKQDTRAATLLKLKTSRLKFSAHKDNQGSRIQIDLTVLARLLSSASFSIVPSLSINNGLPEFSISKNDEPVVFGIPMPMDPAIYFDQINDSDISNIASYYDIDKSLLVKLQDQIKNIVAGDGSGTAFVFGLTELAFKFGPPNKISLGGKLELVQLPSFLNHIIPASGVRLGLEGSAQNINISLETDGEKPMVHIPLGKNTQGTVQIVDIYLKSLKLLYDWKSNAFGFSIDQHVDFTPDDLIRLDSPYGGFSLNDTTGKLAILTTATVPSIPYPQWDILFHPQNPQNGKNDLGLQAWLGGPPNYLARMYLKQNSLSPTMFCFMPGAILDGGFILGNIDPNSFLDETGSTIRTNMCKALTDYESRLMPKNQFFVLTDLQNGSLVMMNSLVGMLMNPTGAPPPVHIPPNFAIDFFFDKISIAANIPQLMFVGMNLVRPRPDFDLFCILDIFGLVQSGFSKPVRPESPLAKLFYFDINVDLCLTPWGSNYKKGLNFQINLIDVINAGVEGFNLVKALLFDAGTIVKKIENDPSFLIELIPKELRKVTTSIRVSQLGLSASASVFLLTPDELRKELRLFHENEKECPKKIPAPGGSTSTTQRTPGPVINKELTPVFTYLYPVKKLLNKDVAIKKNSVHYTNLVSKTKAENERRSINANQELATFKAQIQAKATATAKNIWSELRLITPLSNAETARILARYKLEQYASEINKLITRVFSGSGTAAPIKNPHTESQVIHELSIYLLSKIEPPSLNGLTIAADDEKLADNLAQDVIQTFTAIKNQKILVGSNDKSTMLTKLKAAPYNKILKNNGFVSNVKNVLDDEFIDFDSNKKDITLSTSLIKKTFIKELKNTPDVVLVYEHLEKLVPSVNEVNARFDKALGEDPVFKTELRSGLMFNAWSGQKLMAQSFKLVNPKAKVMDQSNTAVFPDGINQDYQLRNKLIQSNKAGTFTLGSKEVFDATGQILRPDTEWVIEKETGNKYILAVFGPKGDLKKNIPTWLTQNCINEKAVRDRLEICRFQSTGNHRVTNQKFSPHDEGKFNWDPKISLTPESIIRIIKADGKFVAQVLTTINFDVVASVELPTWLTEIDPLEQLRSIITITPDSGKGFKLANKQVAGLTMGVLNIEGLKTATPELKLDITGTKITLHVIGANKSVEKSLLLPNKVTDIINPPDTEPLKLQVIRSRLKIATNFDWLPLTPGNQELTEQVEKNESNYQLSILAREEFKVKDDGGKHGPFYLGDMFISGGKYYVPSSPIFLGGFTATLFEDTPYKTSLTFTGLISGDRLFLRAFHSVSLLVNNSKISLEGEFVGIAGDWPGDLDAGLPKNSISFNGSFIYEERDSIRSDFREVFKTNTNGSISPKGFDLTGAICISDSMEIDLAGFDLAKAKIEFEGDCRIQLDGSKLQLSSSINASAEIEVFLPHTRWVYAWSFGGHKIYRPDIHWNWESYESDANCAVTFSSNPLKALINVGGHRVEIAV